MADNWRIVDQQERDELQTNGRIERVMRVTFETVSGVTSSVDVPLDSYVPDLVRDMVEEKAARIIEVSNL